MKPDLAESLCTQCGLCCDGSLFADVELASSKESAALEAMGLNIEDGDQDGRTLLLQPCRALKNKRCSIYPHRPNCCRTFECRLLMEVKRGTVSMSEARGKITEALKRIEHVAQLMNRLGCTRQASLQLPFKERCLEALALAESRRPDAVSRGKIRALEIAIASAETLIQKTFLEPVSK